MRPYTRAREHLAVHQQHPMKALITGAGGFVGQHLLRHLEDQGDEVIPTDRVTDGLDILDAAALLGDPAKLPGIGEPEVGGTAPDVDEVKADEATPAKEDTAGEDDNFAVKGD